MLVSSRSGAGRTDSTLNATTLQLNQTVSETAQRSPSKLGALAGLSLSMLLSSLGTSIANALRVYSESLRVKRQHKAEEMAAKTTVKMAFPLVLCVFPAILMVVGAPAAIRLMETLRNMQH